MNNEEEADLSLSSVIFSAGMIVWSIVEKSLSLSFSALTYPYNLLFVYPIFCYKLLLSLPIFPDVTLYHYCYYCLVFI